MKAATGRVERDCRAVFKQRNFNGIRRARFRKGRQAPNAAKAVDDCLFDRSLQRRNARDFRANRAALDVKIRVAGRPIFPFDRFYRVENNVKIVRNVKFGELNEDFSGATAPKVRLNQVGKAAFKKGAPDREIGVARRKTEVFKFLRDNGFKTRRRRRDELELHNAQTPKRPKRRGKRRKKKEGKRRERTT